MEVGGIVTLELRVDQVTDLYGYQVYLDYDPTLLQAVNAAGQPAGEVEMGFFLAADFVLQSIDPAAGRVSVMVSVMGNDPASGSGVLFTLRFKGLARHRHRERRHRPEPGILAGADGMAIPYTARDASLYVGVEAPPPVVRLCLPVVVGGVGGQGPMGGASSAPTRSPHQAVGADLRVRPWRHTAAHGVRAAPRGGPWAGTTAMGGQGRPPLHDPRVTR
jgi:hypothetical protein